MDPVERNGQDSVSGVTKANGVTYVHALTLKGCGDGTYDDYDLSREWSTFTATVSPSDDTPASQSYQLTVLVDGVARFDQPMRLGEAWDLDIPVNGALRIRFQMTRLTGSDCEHIVVGNPQVVR
ncbi:MAG: hypothetical protein QOI95_3112 [Acidimicrobiaceae bacterium]